MNEKDEFTFMEKRSKKYRWKKGARLKLGLILFAIIAIIIVIFVNQLLSTAPVDANSDQKISFQVENGATTKHIAANLMEHGLIENELAFLFYVKTNEYDGKLRVGSYQLSKNMSIEEITDELLKGIGETFTFTIPEGYTSADIAAYFAQKEIMSEDEFWQTIANISLEEYSFSANDTDDATKRLEGYLFPDTYKIGINATPEQIITAMLDRFEAVALSLENNSGLSFEEMVILASLVESEAKLDSERATIASVYLNRLDIDMLLQCDATVLYALGTHKEQVLYRDLEYDSPYNTYRYAGLPPTAICNPGEASLKAACYPEDTNYYYYLWSKDEEVGHVFAKNSKEHASNRVKYGY